MKEIKLKISDDLLRKLESMKISMGDKDDAKLIARALGLLDFVNTQRCKGYTKVIVKNPHNGKFFELTDSFWEKDNE